MTLIEPRPNSAKVETPAAVVPPAAPARQVETPAAVKQPAPQQWGDPAPLALAAFALTTFLLSMIFAKLVDKGIEPMVLAMALVFGGGTQLVSGIVVLRRGKTFAGVLFCGFGSFWLSFWVLNQFYIAEVPKAEAGHAVGLYVFAWAAFIVWLGAASLRTNVVVVSAFIVLIPFVVLLGIGEYRGVSGLVTTAGYLGLVAAALAAYLSCAELCEDAYGRYVLPIGKLDKKN